MASRLQIFRQDDFTGGLNLRADQFQLAPNESPKMLNVEVDPRGGVFNRGGMRRIHPAAIIPSGWNPMNLFPFYGASNYLMLSTGYSGSTSGKVLYSTGSSFADLGISVSSVNGASFAPWGKTLYIATGTTNASQKWDGSVVTGLSASGPTWQDSYTSGLTGGYMPKAEHAVVHAGKVFVANTMENGVAFPNRIRWSHPNSPENWASMDSIDINDGGNGITALATFGGHLVVFKPNAVFAIFGYDSDTFQVVEISKSLGVLTPHAVCSNEHGVYFYSITDGLQRYSGNSIVNVFEAIKPAIVNRYINPNALNRVFVNYINHRIWVSVPYSESSNPTYSTAIFVLDTTVSQRGTWLKFSTYDNSGIAGGCNFIKSDGTEIPVVAHAYKPFVLQVEQYNTPTDLVDGVDNQQFTSYYRTRWFDGGNYSSKKMFRRPDIVVKQNADVSSLTIKAYGDYEEADSGEIKQFPLVVPASGVGMIWGISKWGESSWGGTNVGSQIVLGRSIGLARSIQLEFVGAPAKSWGINSFTLKYNQRRIKQ